ncbi:MAG TPA: type II and III secretion system protein family protein [Tepidisphaeraceae bacterium]|jgi:pilus assembly protein CpaC
MPDVRIQNRNGSRRLGARIAIAAGLVLSSAALTWAGEPAVVTEPPVAPADTSAAITENVAQTAPSATQPVVNAPAPGVQLIATGLDATGGKITLTANQSRQIRFSGPVRTIDVTQPDTVMAKVVSPTDVMLTAKKPGTSQLVLWDDAGRSQAVEVVVVADLATLTEELKKSLPDVKIDVSVANGTIILRGRVPDAQTAEQVVQIAAPHSGTMKPINLLEIGGGQQIMLQVRFTEVSKDAVNALGVNFGISNGVARFGGNIVGQVAPIGITSLPGTVNPVLSIPNPGANVTQFGSFVAGVTPFEVFLTAMRQNNLLRVLAEPNLTVLSGKEANFLAGGEFPYPVPQNNGTGGSTITIEYKPYGVRLNFLPVALGNGRIRLHVVPEVSDLDYSNAVTLSGFVIPGLTKRTADTTVELAEGQTLALAGLLNTRVRAVNTTTPLLGDIPILGALFRSVRYERSETELVVMVTPRLAAGMNPDQVPSGAGEKWRYPSSGQAMWNADMGGPAAETQAVPAAQPPKRFQGAYGFTPIHAPVADASR